MSTTLRVSAVAKNFVADLAADITEQLLQVRRVFLKGRAPASPYVHQLRRDIVAQKAKPVPMVLSLSIADLEDGAPLTVVLQPYFSAISVLTELAQQLGAAPPATSLAEAPLLPLLQRENRLQADRDAAERELIADPTSVAAHDRLIAVSARYAEANERCLAVVTARRAKLVTSTPRMTVLV